MQTLPEDHKARIAAEVAARYGVQCSPEAVQIVPRGASSHPGYIYQGNQLVMKEAPKGIGGTLRAAINAGWREAARKRRVSAARAREEFGEPVKSQREIAAEARLAQVRDMAARGMPAVEIGRYLDLHEKTVRNFCLRHGIELARPPAGPKRSRWHDHTARAVAFISEAPRTAEEIAAFMGSNVYAARRFCRKKGLAFIEPIKPEKPKKERVKRTGMSPVRIAARDARRKQVAAFHAQGMKPAEMMARLGVTKSPIYRDHRALGLKPHPNVEATKKRGEDLAAMRRAAVEKRRAEVLRLREEGKSIPKIAEALGASDAAIQRDMVALGISTKKHPCGYVGDPRYLSRVQAMRVEKMSVREIAEHLNLAKSTVSRMVNALRRAG